MAANTQDASASSNSNTIPQEIIVIIDLKGSDITEYHGTKAMLESEGIIPEDFEWPEGFNDVHWKDDRFNYWLRRRRPEGAKGSRKQFANVDWFGLRWDLIDEDPIGRIIARKAKELKDLVYLNSSKGFAEDLSCRKRYWKARDDKQFQAFKAKIPCLATAGRDRKAAKTNTKNEAIPNSIEDNNNGGGLVKDDLH